MDYSKLGEIERNLTEAELLEILYIKLNQCSGVKFQEALNTQVNKWHRAVQPAFGQFLKDGIKALAECDTDGRNLRVVDWANKLTQAL